MKILSTELSEFGPFRHLKVNTNANLVGLAGPSGSGKTTILTGIRYALTSDLGEKSDRAASFIRNYDPTKNARVVITAVSPQGNFIEIAKTIKHSATERSLIIDGGKPITSAKGFDEALSPILQADSSTVSRLVFTSQGALATLLGSLVSEREKLFTRVLDVDFLRAASTALRTRVQTLRSSVVDFMPTLRGLTDTMVALQSEIVELDRIITSVQYDPRRRLQELQEYLNWEATVVALERKLNNRRGELSLDKVNRGSLPDLKSVETELEEKSKTRRRAREDLDIINARNSSAGVEDTLKRLKATVDRLTQEIDTLTATRDPSTYPHIRDLSICDSIRAASASYCLIDDHCESLNSITLREDEEAFVSKINKVYTELTLAREIKNLRSIGVSGDVCPLCTSPLSGKHLHWEDNDEVNLRALQEKHRTMQDTLNQFKTNRKNLQDDIDEEKRSIVNFTSRYANLILAGLFTMDEVKSNPAKVIDTVTREYEKQVNDVSTIAKIKDLQQELLRATTMLESVGKATSVVHASPVLYSTADEASAVIAALQERIDWLNNVLHRITLSDKHIKGAEEEIESILSELSVTVTKKPDIGNAKEGFDNTVDAVEAARAKLSSHELALTMRRQKQDVLLRIQESITDTQKKVERNLKQVEWINSLDTLAQKLDETAKLYIRRQFDSMVGVVLSVLETMAVNFTVRQDINTPLSFEFRPMVQSSVWHSQSKLSGGQKVRLSLAFLIAVQRALLPGIGLLVLDEPSLHLGEADKKHLAELLGQLAHTTFSGDRQIIVCDHSHTVLENCEIIINTDKI